MPIPSDEAVEVVDGDGNVVEIVTRGQIRERNLRHRCTYVVVRSAADGGARVLAHHRAPWKDVWPARWDIAFGGVCGPGEPWDDAARRELAEEAGIAGDIEPLGEGSYESPEVSVHGRIYQTFHDGPFHFADGEVTEVAWVPLADLDAWLAERPACPDSVALVAPRLP